MVALSSSHLTAKRNFCTWLQPGKLGQTHKEGMLHGELLSHLSASGCPHEGRREQEPAQDLPSAGKAALKGTSSTPALCHHVDINQASGYF